jgi:S-adenosylmethionine decarboxylase proenzyme
MSTASSLSAEPRRPNGLHQTIDFFGCDLEQTEQQEFWSRLLREALAETQLTILHERMHAFTPQGLTGIFLLSTSHFSFHTWPEHGYVACDLFSCGDEAEGRSVMDRLRDRVQHERCVLNAIHRGYRFEALRT